MAELGVTYKHVSWSPETEDYLKTLGGSDELVKKVLASKPSITYLDAGDGKVRLVSKGEGREKSVTFKFGETYEDTGFDGNVSQVRPNENLSLVARNFIGIVNHVLDDVI